MNRTDIHICRSTTDGNVNEIVVGQFPNRLVIRCQDSISKISCFDVLQIDRQYNSLIIVHCPSSLLSCVSPKKSPFGLNQQWVENINLLQMAEPLKEEHVQDLNILKTLTLALGADTPISISSINALKNLEKLEVYRGKLPAHKFSSTSLQEMHLKRTNMENLYLEVFKGLPNLRTLFMIEVKVEHIRAGFFEGLFSLEYLVLRENNLKSIEVDAFVSTPNLRELEIIANPLESFADQSNTLASLQVLFIECIKENNLNGTEFKMASSVITTLLELKNVTIRHCNLHKRHVNSSTGVEDTATIASMTEKQFTELSPISFINLRSLKFVELPSNCIDKLSDVMFSNVTSLERLNLEDNKIKELPKNLFKGLKELVSLDLSKNDIEVLHSRMFFDLKALQTLNLSNNVIVMLSLHVFDSLSSLTELYLQNNNLLIIDFEDRGISPFTYLSSLRKMDLSNNKIRELFLTLPKYVPSIEYLNVSDNRLEEVLGLFSFRTKKNVTIDLSRNNVQTIPPYLLPKFKTNTSSDIYVYLYDNPFVCDCNAYVLYLNSKGIHKSESAHLILGNSTCSDPPHLKGKAVVELSPTDLVCDYVVDKCPHNCSCVFRPALKEMVVDCNLMPTALPIVRQRAQEYYALPHFYTYTLNLKSYPNINLLDLNIKTLNLSNIELRNITFNLTDNLKILDLSRNNISTLPDTFLAANVTLYLADNPLQCDCSLVKSLTENRVVDYNQTYCADGTKLSKVDVANLCAWKFILIKHICIGIITAIFLFKIGLLMFRYYMKRKRINATTNFLRRGSTYSIQMEARLDIVKEYDLFLSFAHEDTEFVKNKLLPKLEKDCGQKVCVHHRDWVAGELIENQIIQSVESARRTMIILTEAFILSEWSYLEFRTAHNMSIREGKPRVIIILLKEDIVNDNRLSRDIKTYTNVNTYLVWDDPDFWRKLKQVLPRRSR